MDKDKSIFHVQIRAITQTYTTTTVEYYNTQENANVHFNLIIQSSLTLGFSCAQEFSVFNSIEQSTQRDISYLFTGYYHTHWTF